MRVWKTLTVLLTAAAALAMSAQAEAGGVF
jgi:hypothetical protein